MTTAIKTWSAHTEPSKHSIETAAPIILQVAPTMTAGTWPHSFAVPLQLFADDDLLQPRENWLGVRELQTHIFGRAASALVQRPQLRRRDAAISSTPV
jgi:hypothetical protein